MLADFMADVVTVTLIVSWLQTVDRRPPRRFYEGGEH